MQIGVKRLNRNEDRQTLHDKCAGIPSLHEAIIYTTNSYFFSKKIKRAVKNKIIDSQYGIWYV